MASSFENYNKRRFIFLLFGSIEYLFSIILLGALGLFVINSKRLLMILKKKHTYDCFL